MLNKLKCWFGDMFSIDALHDWEYAKHRRLPVEYRRCKHCGKLQMFFFGWIDRGDDARYFLESLEGILWTDTTT